MSLRRAGDHVFSAINGFFSKLGPLYISLGLCHMAICLYLMLLSLQVLLNLTLYAHAQAHV